MDNPVVRNIVAAVAGTIIAFLVVGLVEMAGHAMFPPPAGLDITDPQDQARIMEAIPPAAKVMVLVAWFLGALVGTWLARHLGASSWPSLLVVALMIAASLWTTQMFPHPWWMVAGALLLPVLALVIASRAIPRPHASKIV